MTEEKKEDVRKKWLSLAEVIIVIVVIIIIAAVAIPSMIKSKISANEGVAAAGLKTYNGMLETFKKSNYQGRGRKYPQGYGPETNSGKFCALYYQMGGDGWRITLIGVADANADMRADGDTDAVEGEGFYQSYWWTRTADKYTYTYLSPVSFQMCTKAGYWFGIQLCLW